jgi:acyl-CoA dehydrogenase
VALFKKRRRLMELTREQMDVKAAAREFAEGEFRDRAKEFDETETFDLSLHKKAAEFGFVGAFIKEEYGGPDLGVLGDALIWEEFWRVDPGCGIATLGRSIGSVMLQDFGTEEQKRELLPRIVTGDLIAAIAITEPDAGSDVIGAKTRAERKRDKYIINGNKMFVTNGTMADYVLVFCITERAEKNPHKRYSFIRVDRGAPGLEAVKIKGKMGIRAMDTAEVSFNNVEVPAKNLIGSEGNGFYELMTFFDKSRVHVAAQGVGVAQGSLEMAVSYVKKRKAFGSTLSALQGVQLKLADMATRIEAARGLYWRAGYLADKGKTNSALSSMAKWYGGETGVYVANEALQLHGGYGYIADYDIQRFYRDAKIVEIYEGTKEVEKSIIGKDLLERVF